MSTRKLKSKGDDKGAMDALPMAEENTKTVNSSDDDDSDIETRIEWDNGAAFENEHCIDANMRWFCYGLLTAYAIFFLGLGFMLLYNNPAIIGRAAIPT